jgi:NAD-dependent deacetylase
VTPESLERAASALATARRVVVSTGAGMSRESGIPTFRDTQEGLWARFDPQQLATESGFRAAPARVWSWYEYRRARMAACEPHAGHRALVELEALVPDLTVVTQNIDGLHQLAGSAHVVELHGSIRRVRCIDCGLPGSHPARADGAEDPEDAGAAERDPPPCAACGSHLRPDVVWFGEMLPRDATDAAWDLAGRCDVLLVVGTSGMVWPAAELPYVARRGGARVVEINPQPSEVTGVADIFLQGPAGEILPRLVGMALERSQSP